MRIKKEEGVRNNTKIAFAFVFFVIGIFLISLVFRGIMVLAQSKFDGKNRFSISIESKNRIEIISLSPQMRTISIFKLKGDTKNLDFKKYMAIPLDGFLIGNSLNTDKGLTSFVWDAIVHYGNIKTNLTVPDFIRIFLFTRSVSRSDIDIKDISTSLNPLEVDKIISQYIRDSQIEKEGRSIEIVNGTDVSGLGNRLARFVTNMGGEVVLVSTSDKLQDTSSISYAGKRTYTIEKLGRVLTFKEIQKNEKSIADITIVIGRDSLSGLNF